MFVTGFPYSCNKLTDISNVRGRGHDGSRRGVQEIEKEMAKFQGKYALFKLISY
ncbi:MAG: hypothetical protein AB8U25_06790 [Rickettsiales endosymbiont of Dermacentor nuttalli]